MNAVVKHEEKPQLVAGANVSAIIPRNIEETFRLAGAIAKSGLAPSTLNTPDKVMVAIMAGAELGLAPFQSLQSFAVVNGRAVLWGDGLVAVARSNGAKIKEWTEGHGDAMVAHCLVTRPDGEEIERAFSVPEAKKAGLWGKQGPWQQYPQRMLQMRARAYAVRDGCADYLRGFQVREEVEDYQPIRDVTPAKSGIAARLESHGAAPGEGFHAGVVSAGLGETVEAEFEPVASPPEGDDAGQPEGEESATAGPPNDPAPVMNGTSGEDPAHDEGPQTDGPGPQLKKGSDLLREKDLANRAKALADELKAAETVDALEALWAGASQLRGDLGEHAREWADRLGALFNERMETLT